MVRLRKMFLLPNSHVYNYNMLSPSDVVCLTVFLTCSSHKKWHRLDLNQCYIRDRGVKILHRELTRFNLTITRLTLSNNGLTESCFPAINDIIVNCRVKELSIDNDICESEKLNLITSDPSSTLEILSIASSKLSSVGAIKLFTTLSEATCKLKKLNVYGCGLYVTNEVCYAIVMAMKNNTSLAELNIRGNLISNEHMKLIIEALQHNITLKYLFLPSIHIKFHCIVIISLVDAVNMVRKSHYGCKETLRVYCGLHA